MNPLAVIPILPLILALVSCLAAVLGLFAVWRNVDSAALASSQGLRINRLIALFDPTVLNEAGVRARIRVLRGSLVFVVSISVFAVSYGFVASAT